MTRTDTSEYRDLALQSSNEMMEHDSRRVLGRYPQAALHIRNAGLGRLRMGQIMSDAGDFPQAAADWLCAGECFYLVPDLERMRACVERVQKLNQEGKIPPDRRDIHDALKERGEQIKALEQKIRQFLQDCTHMAVPDRTAQEALDFLQRQVREFPGLPNLHNLIAFHALRLKQLPLATQHLDWAEKFDPGNREAVYLRVELLIASGEPQRAIQIGRELLRANPEMDHLRTLLAETIAFREGTSKADLEEAIEILQPIVENSSAHVAGRLQALAQVTMNRHKLGQETEYRRLLKAFDQLAEAIQLPVARDFVARLRQAFPQIFPQPGSNGPAPSATERRQPSAQPDYSAAALIFRQLNSLPIGAA